MGKGRCSFDGELTKHVERMPERLQEIHDHLSGKRREIPEIVQLRTSYPKGFRELEQAVGSLETIREEIISSDSDMVAVINVEVQFPREVRILVGNGHRSILEKYFDRVFLFGDDGSLRVAPNKGVLEASLLLGK